MAYLRFYYRPKYIAKSIMRLKSMDELSRSVKTAWQMLINDPTTEIGMEVVG